MAAAEGPVAEKISGSERSEPEIFSCHFSSSVMAAFASFILSL